MTDDTSSEEAMAMAMDTVLKTLEARVEELVEAYRTARARELELTQRVAELEERLAEGAATGDRVAALQTQRADLLERLEKVLATLDATLDASPPDAAAD